MYFFLELLIIPKFKRDQKLEELKKKERKKQSGRNFEKMSKAYHSGTKSTDGENREGRES